MDSTIILMDIDGTLAPLGGSAHMSSTWRTSTVAREDHPSFFRNLDRFMRSGNHDPSGITSRSFHFNTEVIAALSMMERLGDAQWSWLTMWMDDAISIFAPQAGLGSAWSVLGEDIDSPFWKHDVVAQVAGENDRRHVIVVDDSFTEYPEDEALTNSLITEYPNISVLAPNPLCGLRVEAVAFMDNAVRSGRPFGLIEWE